MTSLIDPATTIGAVTLSVADLNRSLDYYQHQIGLALLAQSDTSATVGVGITPWHSYAIYPTSARRFSGPPIGHSAAVPPGRQRCWLRPSCAARPVARTASAPSA